TKRDDPHGRVHRSRPRCRACAAAFGNPQAVCGHPRAARRAAQPLPWRDPCADGAKRRGQVHADQGADGRAGGQRRPDAAGRRSRVARFAAGRAAPGHQHRVPGGQPLPQPLGGREHLCGPLPALRHCAGLSHRLGHAAPARPRSGGAHRLQIDVTRLLSDYPVAVQQLVAIARALSIESRVLILDEPTSSLDDDEVQKLFEVLRRLRSEGLSIVFVTHFLNQVYAVSDRITVLRNGSWVGEWLAKDLGPQALIAAMLGRDLAAASEQPAPAPAVDSRQATLLQTEGLGQDTQLQPLDLQIRAGEVVGLAGLLGSGRTELARLLFGLEQPDRGALRIDGQVVRFANPMDAIRHGLALCPEERKTDGIVAELSVRENIALALQARMGVGKFLSRAEQTALAERY
ncbi:hypothetical protein BVRB_018850, partial [Beta vulgaris subsp. vulgaris]